MNSFENALESRVFLNITHDSETLTVEEASTMYKDVVDGFNSNISDISFKYDEFISILNEIKRLHPDIKEYDYSRNKNFIFKKYIGENIRLYVRGNYVELVGSFCLKEEDSCKLIWDIYNKNTKDEASVDIIMYSYSMSSGQVQESNKIFKQELDYISPKYYPYIDIDLMFDQFFTGQENILLCVGEPGLGKSKLGTYALKYAVQNPDRIPYDKLKENPALEQQYISAAMVKSVEVLANDNFWRAIEKITPDFVIIDDLDYMLTKRDADVQSSDDYTKNAFLNQFLSFTDGVEKHKTKFIITTNQSYDNIDSALLRKGRLFDILELRKLDKKEALDVWLENNLSETEFNKLFKSHEILPAVLGSEINKRLNKRIKNTTSSYLKEDGISKIIRASRNKKIGI